MKSPIYQWLLALASQFIEGAADAFLAVTGGNTAAQLTAVAVPAITPKQLLLSMALLGGIYVASFLKKNPTPWATSPASVTVPVPSTDA